jgi:secreted trypsin-like serine protease
VHREDYILGGEEVEPKDYPFIVRLTKTNGVHLCTGSLVGNGWGVLTAAHCFENSNIKTGLAIFNDYHKYEKDRKEFTVGIRGYRKYKGTDLAIAFLRRRVTEVRSVKISRKTPRKGDILKAVGYGMKGLGEESKYLKHIDLQVSRSYANIIRTKVGRNNEGPCAGDSGGPLLNKEDGQWKVMAILWVGGYDCGTGYTSGDDWWNSVNSIFSGSYYFVRP